MQVILGRNLLFYLRSVILHHLLISRRARIRRDTVRIRDRILLLRLILGQFDYHGRLLHCLHILLLNVEFGLVGLIKMRSLMAEPLRHHLTHLYLTPREPPILLLDHLLLNYISFVEV